MSKAEREFRGKYPNANVRPTGREYCPFAVYAGDYICAEGSTRAAAFKLALDYDEAGIITPDPQEQATVSNDAGFISPAWILPLAVAGVAVYAIAFMASHGVFQALSVFAR